MNQGLEYNTPFAKKIYHYHNKVKAFMLEWYKFNNFMCESFYPVRKRMFCFVLFVCFFFVLFRHTI